MSFNRPAPARMKRLRALLPATFPGRTFFRGSLLALLGSVLLLRCDSAGDNPLATDPPEEPIDLALHETQKLTASDPQAGEQFGFSVAVSGDLAVIGAYNARAGSAGAAYLFDGSSGAWTEVATLTASDAQAGDLFGFSVAVSGAVAIVGAVEESVSGFDAGAAYLFEQSGGAWAETTKLTASDAEAGDWFGLSVAVSSGVAMVGAYGSGGGMAFDAGFYPTLQARTVKW